MKRRTQLLAILMFSACFVQSQSLQSILSGLDARCIGPRSWGRMSAIAVYERDSKIMYLGSSYGGVFKTTDGGRSTFPVFDKEGASDIGAIAVSQKDPDLVWVGTGDGWQRNDYGRGDGVYKSTDGGKTWKNMGLPKSNSIGKIIIDPQNNNNVFVAVIGSGWGYGPDRGVYRTTDGGQTWKHVLFVNDSAGAADIAINPKNPKILLAAMWDHLHRPWHYEDGGPSSGIYRSADGGETWNKITAGLPKGNIGRIAIDFFRADPNYVAATIEEKRPGSGFYRSRDAGKTWKMEPAVSLDDENKPKSNQDEHWGRPYYNNLVVHDPVDKDKIYHANWLHFTADGGKTFHGGAGDDHLLWIDPQNPKHAILGGDVGVSQTWSGGEDAPVSLQNKINLPPIGPFYTVGYDMRKLYHVMGAMQDVQAFSTPTQTYHGGVEIGDSYDLQGGEAGGEMADPNDWTTVYSGGRMLAFARWDLKTHEQVTINGFAKMRPGSAYTDPSDYAAYMQSNPRLRQGYYGNFVISPWNSHTLYFATNHLLKSTDRGDHWEVISPDLTHNNLTWQIPNPTYYQDRPESSGATVYQAIHCISESPLKRGLIWVGTDDGYVQLTKNDGKSWENVINNVPDFPENTWVSSVVASRFVEGRAYATFDGHKNCDYRTYVYKTEDYGKTWTKIVGNLPVEESCYVIREGLKNPDLLFLGTEKSLWVSLDRGQTWARYQTWKIKDGSEDKRDYFPTVAIYDMHIHPREDELIIGTHGRSIWTVPVRALEELTPDNREKDVYFTSPGTVYLFPTVRSFTKGYEVYGGVSENTQPGTLFSYFLKHDFPGEATIRFEDAAGNELTWKASNEKVTLKGATKAGLNSIRWMNPLNDGLIRQPGDYRAVLTVGGKDYVQLLHVEDATEEILPGSVRQPASGK